MTSRAKDDSADERDIARQRLLTAAAHAVVEAPWRRCYAAAVISENTKEATRASRYFLFYIRRLYAMKVRQRSVICLKARQWRQEGWRRCPEYEREPMPHYVADAPQFMFTLTRYGSPLSRYLRLRCRQREYATMLATECISTPAVTIISHPPPVLHHSVRIRAIKARTMSASAAPPC